MTEPPDEYEVALVVAAALEAIGAEYALGGSAASSLQGEPRASNDIDFAVRLEERHVAALAARLGTEFAVDEPALHDAIRTRLFRLHSRIGYVFRITIPENQRL